MGRKKQFDESEVLKEAMSLFWKQGYEGTTFAALERRTGISGRSLINCFGDKENLYASALAAYIAMAKDIFAELFAKPGIEAIKSLFRQIESAPDDSPGHFGCLMCNTIYEKEYAYPRFAETVDSFRALLLQTFRQSLAADGIRDATDRAEFLLYHFWGVMTETRRSGSTRVTKLSNRVLFQLMDGWKAAIG
jgi:TetR/AcrR family transcriptional repressor of nem operon